VVSLADPSPSKECFVLSRLIAGIIGIKSTDISHGKKEHSKHSHQDFDAQYPSILLCNFSVGVSEKSRKVAFTKPTDKIAEVTTDGK
jgi:hypothetical protein